MSKNNKHKNFIVAIIPARSGSKGLKNKNIYPLNNKPLISYTINAAKNCKYIDKVVVTTDSNKIALISKKFGAEVPFLRSKKLSGDKVPCNPVLKDCLIKLEKIYQRKIDIVLYMQPTEIFRKMWMLNTTIETLIKNNKYDSAFVAYETHKNFWKEEKINHYKRIEKFSDKVRQRKKSLLREDTGLACATRRETIMNGTRIGKNTKIIPHHHELGSIDIHSISDVRYAEALLKSRFIKINN